MEITPPELEAYMEGLLAPRHPVLLEMEAEGKKRGFPLVGPMVGTMLAVLARAVGARRVLELGSGFGYSAFWFAEALPEEGRLLAFEHDPENVKLAEDYFARAGLAEKAEFRVGDALELIEAESGPFDIIFVDIDKHSYPQVPAKALPRLRAGGLLVTDNTLWFGRVLGEPEDDWAAGVQAYNRMVSADPGLVTVIIPLRDGVAVSLKL